MSRKSMLQLLVLVLFISAGQGLNETDHNRIVGGTLARDGEFPYQVSLRLQGRHMCGASIVNQYFAVTAAHCVSRVPENELSLLVGTNFRNFGGTEHRVVFIFAHPRYDSETVVNDIAIVMVNTPMQFSKKVAPVQLPSQGLQTPAGTMATVTGWGTIMEGIYVTDGLLRKVDVPIVSKLECSMAYVEYGGIPDTAICAGYPRGGKDSCQGDSGGPLIANGYLAGIVSWGRGCARSGYPGVYTEVSAYRDWIRSISGV